MSRQRQVSAAVDGYFASRHGHPELATFQVLKIQ
jgi:hypothetical protein